MLLRYSFGLTLLFAIGCVGRTPSRFQIVGDTLTVNTTFTEAVPTYAFDASGKRMTNARFSYSTSPSAILVAKHQGIQCLKDGFGTVTLRAGPAAASAIVHCDLATRFGLVQTVYLSTIGQKTIFGIEPYDAAGVLIPHPRLAVTNSNPKVVRLDRGVVTALHPGTATISASSGRASGGTIYVVTAQPHH